SSALSTPRRPPRSPRLPYTPLFRSNVLPDGTYTFTATATDLAGNTGDSSDGFVVTVDTVAPDAPVITSIQDDTGSSDTDGVTSDNTLILSGSAEPGTVADVVHDSTS